MPKYRFDEIAINSTEKKKPVEEDKYTYLGLEHLDSGTLKVSRSGADVAPKGEKLIMKKGDVLFGKRRAYQKKVAIAPFDGIFSAHGMVLRPKEDVINKDFFPMFISSDYFLDAAIAISVGSLSPTINWRDLKELEFELPELEEQQQIADILWAINHTIEAYKELLVKTDELVKSQFIEMFGDIANNPKCYEKVPFKELCYAMGDGLHGTPKYDDNGEFYFINGNNLREKSIVITSETRRINKAEYERLFINMDEKTVLLSINGTLGNTGFYNGEPVALGKSACYCNLGQRLIREFVQGLFASDMFQEFMDMSATGTTIRNFGLKALREYKMIVPPIEEQEEYKKFVEQSDKSKYILHNMTRRSSYVYRR